MPEASADAVVEQQIEQGQETSANIDGEQPVEEQQVEANPLEDEVRKWQSMYDKASADNAKLQSTITEYLNMQQENQKQAQQPPQVQMTEDEFNPWDAYYKPDSPSYQMRVQKEQQLVHSVVDKEIGRIQSEMTLNNTRNELRNNHNMNDTDINEFLDFVSQPKSNVPVGSLVNLWREQTGRQMNQQTVQVPQTKQPTPRTAGTQSNQVPVRKSNESKAWDELMGASKAGRLP